MAEKKTEKKDEKEGTEGEEAPKGKSKKKLLMILIPVILLLVGGGAAFFLMGGKPAAKEGESEEVVEEAKPKKYATLKLDPFIVNLSENISFLKTTVILEFDPEIFILAEKAHAGHGEAHGGGGAGGGAKEEGGGAPARMTERQPMVRDAIIHTLSSKKVADIIDKEGKEKLKEELIESVNEAIGLPENPVVNIYFIEFIIQ